MADLRNISCITVSQAFMQNPIFLRYNKSRLFFFMAWLTIHREPMEWNDPTGWINHTIINHIRSSLEHSYGWIGAVATKNVGDSIIS